MWLLKLCLVLLCAAAGTGSPGAVRDHPLGAAAPQVGGVDPRHAWMLLAGSPRRAGERRPGPGQDRQGPGWDGGWRGTGCIARRCAGPCLCYPGATAALEELLRELQLLLKCMVKEQAKTCRKAWEGCEEEEERGEDNPQNRSHRCMEAVFHCRTGENISIEQRARQELQLYCIPEGEGMFHCGSGLNLTSGQYTAPVTGYYTFTATLHIVRREQWRKGHSCRGNRLQVLICVQSRCQHNSNLETVSQLESGGDFFTVSVTGVLYLQAGQYASVFVDNTADSPLTVQSGSNFSAVLLGV